MLKIHYCFVLSQVPDKYFRQLGSMPLVATPLQCGNVNCGTLFSYPSTPCIPSYILLLGLKPPSRAMSAFAMLPTGLNGNAALRQRRYVFNYIAVFISSPPEPG